MAFSTLAAPALRYVPMLAIAIAGDARVPAPAPAGPAPVLTAQTGGVNAVLQAVSALDGKRAWVSGHKGTVLVTDDGGATWRRVPVAVPRGDSLQFRDVHATSLRDAQILSIGTGDQSGVYATHDGGATWTRTFTNTEPKAFYDCFAFWPSGAGFGVSDAVDGHLPLIRTRDGAAWSVATDALPAAAGTEGGFAASGDCALTFGRELGWIGTGAGERPRVFRTTDAGQTWTAAETPIVRGEGAGITALAFRDATHGIAVGGPVGGKGEGPRVAVSADGGVTWRTAGEPPFAGAIYGAAYAKVKDGWAVVAVGPGGAAWSADDGATWTTLDTQAYWSVGFAADGTGWMVGPTGRITKITWQ